MTLKAESEEASEAPDIERHVALAAPEIHWNTGNIGRTCLGAGAMLHLIEPLGFLLDDRRVRRAGLDYWERVNPRIWKSLDAFIEAMSPNLEDLFIFSKIGERSLWAMPFRRRMVLLFGSETRGLPSTILNQHKNRTYYIPMHSEIRSLNLSTAAGICLYESLRPARLPRHGWLDAGESSNGSFS